MRTTRVRRSDCSLLNRFPSRFLWASVRRGMTNAWSSVARRAPALYHALNGLDGQPGPDRILKVQVGPDVTSESLRPAKMFGQGPCGHSSSSGNIAHRKSANAPRPVKSRPTWNDCCPCSASVGCVSRCLVNELNRMPDSTDPGPTRDTGPAASDEEAGFDILEDFRRFSQRDDIFCRSFWDPEVRTHRSDMFYETYRTPKLTWRAVDGFTQRDYALRNASWHVTDIFAELRGGDDRREGFSGSVHRRSRGPGQHAAGGLLPRRQRARSSTPRRPWALTWWGSPATTSGGSTRTPTAARTSTRSRRRSLPISAT